MINKFKFFIGQTNPYDRVINPDYYTTLQVDPPYGISRRHWNILPQDLRAGDWQEIHAFIEGWETPNSPEIINPYVDNFRLGNIWTRGWSLRRRRTRTVIHDVTNPRHYDTDDFEFFDITETRYDAYNVPYKVMLFRSIDSGEVIEGNIIYTLHPMYNFHQMI